MCLTPSWSAALSTDACTRKVSQCVSGVDEAGPICSRMASPGLHLQLSGPTCWWTTPTTLHPLSCISPHPATHRSFLSLWLLSQLLGCTLKAYKTCAFPDSRPKKEPRVENRDINGLMEAGASTSATRSDTP